MNHLHIKIQKNAALVTYFELILRQHDGAVIRTVSSQQTVAEGPGSGSICVGFACSVQVFLCDFLPHSKDINSKFPLNGWISTRWVTQDYHYTLFCPSDLEL